MNSASQDAASKRPAFLVRIPAVAAMVVLALGLGGCVGSGGSSFGDLAQDAARTSNPANDLQQIPLDIVSADAAASGVIDNTTNIESNALALEPRKLADGSAPLNGEQPIVSLVEEQSATQTPARDLLLAPPAPAVQLAAVAPAQAGLATGLASDLPEMIDPLEAEAQARIPALFGGIEHGQCRGGWGPKPKIVNAKRIDPAHRYYMEMRLRHTPGLPVGHVYIAYGNLGLNGEPADENLVMLAPVGGYVGAAIAAAAPVQGVLTPHRDDCIVRPHAAYRVSLTAIQYEKLLQRIVQAKNDVPKYSLFQYNCNHFLSDVASVTGILPPEDIYKPSLVYFYEMMDRNEGRKVPRGPRELQVETAAARALQ